MERPPPSEHAPYFSRYVDQVPGNDILAQLAAQTAEMQAVWRAVTEEQASRAPDSSRWTLKQVLSHIADTERVFAYRALWIGRNHPEALPSMDQDIFAAGSGANGRSWASLVEEYEAVRAATLALARGLPAEAWTRTGVASGNPMSTRAAMYIIAGHELHHVAIVRRDYL